MCNEFNTIDGILLEGEDVERHGCTIIYHCIKQNAEYCIMVEASRRHGYSEVIDQ